MNRIYGATVMLGLIAWSAVSIEAAELRGPEDGVRNEIVVVNDYLTVIGVYLEDSEGQLHRLGRVGQGKVKRFEASADLLERGHFRVRIRPINQYPGSQDVEIILDQGAQCRGGRNGDHVAQHNRDRGGPAIPVLPLPHHQACGSAPGGSVS